MIMLERDIAPQHRDHVVNDADDFTSFADHVHTSDGEVETDWWGLAWVLRLGIQDFLHRVD